METMDGPAASRTIEATVYLRDHGEDGLMQALGFEVTILLAGELVTATVVRPLTDPAGVWAVPHGSHLWQAVGSFVHALPHLRQRTMMRPAAQRV